MFVCFLEEKKLPTKFYITSDIHTSENIASLFFSCYFLWIHFKKGGVSLKNEKHKYASKSIR